MSETLHGKVTITSTKADDSGISSPGEDVSKSSSHRISIISSESSESITPMVEALKKSTVPSSTSLKRSVSSMSSSENFFVEYSSQHKHYKPDVVWDGRLMQLHNARILQKDGSLLHGSITMDQDNGLIVGICLDADDEEKHEEALMQVFDQSRGNVDVVDCKGHIISPGFIDIQLNGAYGVDFSNAGVSTKGLKVDDMFEVAHKLLATGVTSFCPTMISSSRETYRRIIPLVREARIQQSQQKSTNNKKNGANILGVHLEGPFFASSKRGAHDNTHISAPSKGMNSIREAYGLNTSSDDTTKGSRLEDIDIITMAPELDGAFDAIKSLTTPKMNDGHSVVISCGHTEATYEDGIQAIANGASLLTHLYNAMNPFHHRQPGLVGLLSSESKLGRMGFERPFYSMIVDGVHVHESAVCMAYSSHPHGCVLVTDAMAAMGLGDGTHSLGSMSVFITGDRATLTGTDTLAGSVVSIDKCVRRFKQFTGCSVGEALLCATLHPAMVLKRHVARQNGTVGISAMDAAIGVLEAGASADLVLLNDNLEVLVTVVGGSLAFEKNQSLTI